MRIEETNITLWLIGICVIVYLLQQIFPTVTNIFSFTTMYALSQPWTFVTAIFLHGSATHILFNMIALFFFGTFLERRISKRSYILIFFLSGIIGNLGFMLTMPPDASGLGASGAIYGIMGVLTVLTPTTIVYVSGIPMPMFVAAIFWFILNFFGLLGPGIGYSAHLGGLFFGIFAGFYFRYRTKRNVFIFGKTY